jgi:hypothetical protein
MLLCLGYVLWYTDTNVSEKPTSCIFRMERAWHFDVNFILLPYYTNCTLKMEIEGPFEMPVPMCLDYMASYPRRQQSLKDVQILTRSMLHCNTVHAISTSKILHTNTSGTVDNAVGKLRALGKDSCKESCNYSGRSKK